MASAVTELAKNESACNFLDLPLETWLGIKTEYTKILSNRAKWDVAQTCKYLFIGPDSYTNTGITLSLPHTSKISHGTSQNSACVRYYQWGEMAYRKKPLPTLEPAGPNWQNSCAQREGWPATVAQSKRIVVFC